MWSMIKSKALIILGGLVTVLVSLLSISGWRGRRARKQRDKFKATAKKQLEVMEADADIDEQTVSRRTEALKEIRDTGNSTVFSDPGSLRRKRDK